MTLPFPKTLLPAICISILALAPHAQASASNPATGDVFRSASWISTSAGGSYYVATNGSDTNPGTLALPWRTVQHAADTVQAGGTVYIRVGVYNEQVKIRRSGSAAAGYITLRNYPGETPRIDGTSKSAGSQSGLIDLSSQSYVIVEGLDVGNFKSSKASSVPIGIYVYGSGSHVELLNNHVHDIVTTVNSSSGNALGIAIYGTGASTPISDLVISGNEVDDLVTGSSESVTINGNVDGFQVTGNKVHDNNNIGIDAIGFEGTSPTASLDQARYGSISGNTVYDITSAKNPAYGDQLGADGIYVDGGAHIAIERNLVHHCDLGIELASEHSGKVTSYVTARSNIVYDSYLVGVSIGGYAAHVGGTEHCTIVNNTLYNDDIDNTGSGEFQIQYHAADNVFENNIVYASAQGLLVNNFTANSAAAAGLNYNDWYVPAGSSSPEWIWNNKSYSSLTSFNHATGNDADSKFADPKFANTSTFDLHVSPSSPAVNAGIDLGASVVGALDFAGNPRVQGAGIDIGAYEQ